MFNRPEDIAAAKYWADKQFKKWVVLLRGRVGRKEQTRRYYVQATTRERAVKVAQSVTTLTGRTWGTARLATAQDLGAV